LGDYGAIAWDPEIGKRGWSWNQQTQSRADELALSECGASGCKIIMRTGRRECAALATTETGKYVMLPGAKITTRPGSPPSRTARSAKQASALSE
jgi:hypothetical protein